VLLLSAVFGMIALKAAVVMLVGPLFGLRWATVIETALLTGPGGEFGFVALGAAAAVGALPGSHATQATLVIAVSMFALPFISVSGRRLNTRLEAAMPLPPEALVEPPSNDGERVIIVGFGRVGQLVADMLDEYDVPYIAVDSDARLVARCRADDKPVYYGNAERPEFLRRCGISNAKALVLTMDAPAKVDSLTQIARAERGDLIIVARARDEPHARQLYRLGVTDAVPETTEASLQLGEAVLDEIGIPIGIIIAGIHQRREDSRRALGRKDRRHKAGAKPAVEKAVVDRK
jgi:CPA2 family monovalent cation:H+ antiporter-2